MAKRIGGRPYKKRLLPGLPYPIPIDAPVQGGASLDEGDGWWAGARLASVAIAGAAVALSTSVAIAGTFWGGDDFAPQAAPAGGTSSSAQSPATQRATSATTFQRWFAQDELPQAPPIALDDAGWTPPNPAEPKFTLPVWDDQVITAKVDEDYWWQPYTVTALTVRFDLPTHQDEVVTPATTYGGAGSSANQRAAIESRFQYWPQGDDLPIQAPQLAEESAPVLLPIISAIRAEVFTHQDDLPVAATFTPHEEAEPVLRRSQDSATYTVWAETDDIVPQPASLGVDEAYWWRAQTAIVPVVAPLWQVEDEIVPQPSFTYGGAGAANQRATLEARIRYWPQSDDFPTPVAFTPPEEDGPRLRPSQDSFTYTVWAEDENIVPQAPGSIGFDSDYWLTFPRPPGPLVTSVMQYLPTEEEFPELTAPPQPLTEWRRFAMNRRGR